MISEVSCDTEEVMMTAENSSPISRQFVHILRGGLFVRIRTTSLVQIDTIFAKSYVFYELPIRMN